MTPLKSLVPSIAVTDYPKTKNAFVKLVVNAGSWSAAARQLGKGRSSLVAYVSKRGWYDEINKALRAAPKKPKKSNILVADYPDSDDELVATIVESGSFAAAGRLFGVATASVRQQTDKRGLTDKINAALAESRRQKKAPLGTAVTAEELLRARNRELEQQVRLQRKQEVFEERVAKRLEESLKVITPRFQPLKLNLDRKAKFEATEFVLLFSDTHASETVNPEEVMGMNSYNWDIMLDRMATIQKSVLSYASHRPYPIKKLTIMMLGDMLSGSIHQELAETNELNDSDAICQFALDTSMWLEEFVPYFPEIEVDGCPGNHPRFSKKLMAKQASHSGDVIAYKMMDMYHRRTPNLSFNIGAPFGTVKVADRWRVLYFHGDGITSNHPGVPWGGVMRRIGALQRQFAAAGKPIDIGVCGHFHNQNALGGTNFELYMNGSVKGVDEYSLRRYGSGQTPKQLLLEVHPKWGVVGMHPIDLASKLPAAEVVNI